MSTTWKDGQTAAGAIADANLATSYDVAAVAAQVGNLNPYGNTVAGMQAVIGTTVGTVYRTYYSTGASASTTGTLLVAQAPGYKNQIVKLWVSCSGATSVVSIVDSQGTAGPMNLAVNGSVYLGNAFGDVMFESGDAQSIDFAKTTLASLQFVIWYRVVPA